MPALPEEWRNEELVRFFMRHVVPIYFELRKGEERHHLIYTAFVFSVYDRWMLMTAGHCITKMREYRDHGYQLSKCALIDYLGPRARDRLSVPFDYDGAEPQMLGADPTWDYGVLFPTKNTRALLEANGVMPFTELSWEPELPPIETYRLLGIPEVLTETTPQMMQITMFFPRVEPIDEKPDGFAETTAPMFYGRLAFNPLERLHGLSGSPIFALAHVDGVPRYWLKAMQVSAMRGTPLISGVLMQPLGKLLREMIEGKHCESVGD